MKKKTSKKGNFTASQKGTIERKANRKMGKSKTSK